MAILLTGGTGFIGSHTAVELIQSGYDTVIIDNLSNSKETVIEGIHKITGVRPAFYPYDATDIHAIRKVFSNHSISTVIHLAGLKSVEDSVRNPDKYLQNNTVSTATLLQAMKENNVNNIIFSSSATVYGANNPFPYEETMQAGDFTSPYAKSKAMSEEILTREAESRPELSVVLLRYFNPAGAHPSGIIGEDPLGTPRNLMPLICQAAAKDIEEIYIFGDDYDTTDGTCKRDYLHVMDVARGHVVAIAYAEKNKGVDIFNLGMGRPHSVLEILKTFEKVNGITVPYKIGSRRDGDLPEFWAKVEKAKSVLNWETLYQIEDICRDAWRWKAMHPFE